MFRLRELFAPRKRVLALLAPNAFEVFLLVLCVWSGAGGLITFALTGTVPNVRFSPWLAAGWMALIAFGGIVGIVGCYLSDVVLGRLILHAALWPIGGGVLAAEVGSVYLRDWPTVGLLAAFLLAVRARSRQLSRSTANLVSIELMPDIDKQSHPPESEF